MSDREQSHQFSKGEKRIVITTDHDGPEIPPQDRDTFSTSGPGLVAAMPTRTADDYAVEMRMALEDIRDRARAGIVWSRANTMNTAGPGGAGGGHDVAYTTLQSILDQVALVEQRWWSA